MFPAFARVARREASVAAAVLSSLPLGKPLLAAPLPRLTDCRRQERWGKKKRGFTAPLNTLIGNLHSLI